MNLPSKVAEIGDNQTELLCRLEGLEEASSVVIDPQVILLVGSLKQFSRACATRCAKCCSKYFGTARSKVREGSQCPSKHVQKE